MFFPQIRGVFLRLRVFFLFEFEASSGVDGFVLEFEGFPPASTVFSSNSRIPLRLRLFFFVAFEGFPPASGVFRRIRGFSSGFEGFSLEFDRFSLGTRFRFRYYTAFCPLRRGASARAESLKKKPPPRAAGPRARGRKAESLPGARFALSRGKTFEFEGKTFDAGGNPSNSREKPSKPRKTFEFRGKNLRIRGFYLEFEGFSLEFEGFSFEFGGFSLEFEGFFFEVFFRRGEGGGSGSATPTKKRRIRGKNLRISRSRGPATPVS